MLKSYDSPTPRNSLLGLWDQLIGPGATLAENTVILVSAIAGTIAAALRLGLLEFNILHIVVGAVLGFDIIGGSVCNATDTTKRWYHRPEVSWVQHITFVLLHLGHVAIVAWLFQSRGGFDWNYFSTVSICLLFATIAVLVVPAYLKRPVAVGLYLVSIAIGFYTVGLTTGLEWFIPALFLKLLIGHLVPERSHAKQYDI